MDASSGDVSELDDTVLLLSSRESERFYIVNPKSPCAVLV